MGFLSILLLVIFAIAALLMILVIMLQDDQPPPSSLGGFLNDGIVETKPLPALRDKDSSLEIFWGG